MSSIVLITGATSGFGQSCALLFAEKGHRLILVGRRADRLEKLAANLKQSFNTEVHLLPIDVRNQEAISAGIFNLPASWQDIDILINNAGLAAGRDYFEEAKLDDWNEMIDTNIKGFLYVSQAVAKGMANRKKRTYHQYRFNRGKSGVRKRKCLLRHKVCSGCTESIHAYRSIKTRN